MAAPWGHTALTPELVDMLVHTQHLPERQGAGGGLSFPCQQPSVEETSALHTPPLKSADELSRYPPPPSHRALPRARRLQDRQAHLSFTQRLSPDKGKSQARRGANLFISKCSRIPAATCMLAGWAHCKSQLGGRAAGRGWGLGMGYF